MSDNRATKRQRPELLPWQAALMVACVTAAGLLHEHPGAIRPLVPGAEARGLRSGLATPKLAAVALPEAAGQAR